MKIKVERSLSSPVILSFSKEDTLSVYISNGGFEVLERFIKDDKRREILEEILKSGLKGRGGAAFKTGIKWDAVAKAESDTKFVVCNADEGEPGTFKDKWILENRPFLIIEAMVLCAYAVGASKGYIYIRGEYRNAIEVMKNAIEQAYRDGFLGKNIMGSDFTFDIEIRRGAGSYVCGEETALLESIEGKRAQPRFKPPFPVEKGLWGYPTVVNNVETFANVVYILKNGADWFRQLGTKDSPGTKLFPISGRVREPCLVEANLGVTLDKLIEEAGGVEGEFQCALVGGAAGNFLYEGDLNYPLSYETLKEKGKVIGSGAVLVLNKGDRREDVVRNVLEFFMSESCGKCTPCREGYPVLLEKFNGYLNGSIPKDEILKLSNLMFKTSLCALGQSSKFLLESYFESS